ncbi:hypothetical protein [Mycobacterium simiae]|uniref:hypothetical protein n=1 Tax=Mycobacterium simiae TaxID=1784 RepID=UPI0012DD9C0D|nr:hypothetical protein [Mycobacterium simiae]BBX38921.1 hypothetical protein MSIM_03720 [Mycobacterium simiae]
MTEKAKSHGPAGYNRGCRCDICRGAAAAAKARQRAAHPDAPRNGADVVPFPAAPVVIGPTEQAVIDECATLPKAAECPTVVAQARKVARAIDNPKQESYISRNSHELRDLMGLLRDRPKKKSGGRLAVVQQMSRRVAQ